MKQSRLLRSGMATPVDSARPKGGFIARIGEGLTRLGVRQVRELGQELEAALADGLGQVAFMVGKIPERRRRRALLPLKEHRNLRSEQQQRDHRPPSPGM